MTTAAYTSELVAQRDKKLTVVQWDPDSDIYTASLPFLYVQVINTGTSYLYLHASPDDGEEIIVADHSGACSGQPIEIRVGNNAHTIISAPDGVGINTDYGLLCLKYVGNNFWAILYGR